MVADNIFVIPYIVLIIVGLVYPSDANHGLFSLKSLSFMAAGTGMLYFSLAKQRLNISGVKLFAFTLFLLSFLILWLFFAMLGSSSGMGVNLDQCKLFFITFFIPIATYFYLVEEKISCTQFFYVVVYANFFYCSAKIVLLLLHFLGVVDMWAWLKFLGFAIQRMTVIGNLSRLQSSVDVTAPFLVFFVLQGDGLGLRFSRRFQALYLLVSFVSTIFAFSRFLFAVFGVSIALHLMVMPLTKKVKAAVLACCLSLAFVFAVGVNNMKEVVHQRFFSKESSVSDEIRKDQIQALMKGFLHSPLIGKGLGSYAKEAIRDREKPHSYEVQWIAFLMQFGVVGMALLLLPIFFVYVKIARGSYKQSIPLAVLFTVWLLSGFTNPFLISLQSGILYTLFLTASDAFQQEGARYA